MTRAFDLPGRSPVYATEGMVATSHALASSTALRVLQEGGNAVDAAVAASAVLAVVEPGSTGIGGDCFAIVAEPDGTLSALNSSGRSAAGAHLDWYLENGITNLETNPVHAITAPGAIRGWETLLSSHGTMGFDRVLRDAINYAENGFPISSRVGQDWAGAAAEMAKDEGAAHNFLHNGDAPSVGTMHAVPNLAETMKAIAANGSDAFYTGTIAADIANTVQRLGGFLSEEDLAQVAADWVTPISTRYGGYDIYEIPPNGVGITALIMLNIMDKIDARSFGSHSALRQHAEIECARLAYTVRDAYVADTDHMTVSTDAILSDAYTTELAKGFHADRRNTDITLPSVPHADTVYLTVVDRDLRAVSFINSLYMTFGSKIATKDSGIALQNRGACFVVEDGHPNTIGPSKRPLHTIIPGMAMKDGKAAYSFGVMGGAYQPIGQAHVLSNMIDHGLDPQEALDYPRVFWDEDSNDGKLHLEAGVTDEVAQGMRDRGHETVPATTPHGGGQIIAIDHERGIMTGGSDPRKDGQAQGY
jgi:gamma-glutamyltranspeptidase / glutathione hydrolase